MSEELRTIASLVEEAVAARTGEEAVRCVTLAADQASTFREWETVIDGLSAIPALPLSRRRKVLARARAAAEHRQEIWGFRVVAIAEAHDLDDPAAARETLRAGERMLLEKANAEEALGYEWGVLAEAHELTLRDEGNARRCLSAGWALAWRCKDVENLGRLAARWSQVVDRDDARARFATVESAARDWGDLGGVIYWWHALGDAARGRRVRQTVLETTTVFEEALDLVRYWNLYEKGSPGIEAALDRAEQLAREPEEWLELGHQARVEPSGAALARRALDHAAESATTPETKARVAQAYVEWFEDNAAADKVGPRGLRPEALRMRVSTLDGWDGSGSALFDVLRARISVESLRTIAEADYGDDAEKHEESLLAMCTTGLLPLEMAWHPGEVVELTRWSSGEGVDHLARLLCCVLLCLASPGSEMLQNGPVLVESCLALREDLPGLAERLLVWHYETQEADTPEALTTLLSLFLLHAARQPADPQLARLLQAPCAHGETARGLREQLAGSLRADLWVKLVADILPRVRLAQPAIVPVLEQLGLTQ